MECFIWYEKHDAMNMIPIPWIRAVQEESISTLSTLKNMWSSIELIKFFILQNDLEVNPVKVSLACGYARETG